MTVDDLYKILEEIENNGDGNTEIMFKNSVSEVTAINSAELVQKFVGNVKEKILYLIIRD